MNTVQQRSPNILSTEDTLWHAVYGWDGDPKYIYPFVVRVVRFYGNWVQFESVPRSDDPEVTNDWPRVAFSSWRRTLPAGV